MRRTSREPLVTGPRKYEFYKDPNNKGGTYAVEVIHYSDGPHWYDAWYKSRAHAVTHIGIHKSAVRNHLILITEAEARKRVPNLLQEWGRDV